MNFNLQTSAIIPENENVLSITSTTGILLPTGTTEQRPFTNVYSGTLRYNSTINSLECFVIDTWLPLSLGSSGSHSALSDLTGDDHTQYVITDGSRTISSAVLATIVNDETGTGEVVFSNTPTLTTPVINGFTGDTSIINVGSGQLYKATDGNIGIATITPGAPLSFSNSSGDKIRLIDDTLGSYIGFGANMVDPVINELSTYVATVDGLSGEFTWSLKNTTTNAHSLAARLTRGTLFLDGDGSSGRAMLGGPDAAFTADVDVISTGTFSNSGAYGMYIIPSTLLFAMSDTNTNSSMKWGKINSSSTFTECMSMNYDGAISLGNTSGSTSQYSTDYSLEVRNDGGQGETGAAAIMLNCVGYYATKIYLRSDGYIGMGGGDAESWRWTLNMTTGEMTAGSISSYSDPRLKDNVAKITSPIEKIKQLNGVSFNWKHRPDVGRPGQKDYGFLSTDVEKIAPELVVDTAIDAGDGTKYKAVCYDKITAFLVEAVKEQQEIIEIQKSQILSLEDRLTKLEAYVSELI